MPNWTVRVLLATNLISLALNGVVVYAVLYRPRNAVSAEALKVLNAPPRAAPRRAPVVQFQREYQYVEKSSGQLKGVMLADDSPRLERFVREAKLTANQESELRDRYAQRHERETAMALEMVRGGEWRHADFIQLQKQFWDAEYRSLPPEQTIGLSPEFMPVD